MQHVYLLTGKPGSGKTSLIRQSISGLETKAGGFFTEEIRSHEQRLGFRLVALNGKEAVLAHVSISSPSRVSRYGVDVAALEQVGVASLEQAARDCDLVVVDEIGKMELFSDSFKSIVLKLVSGDKPVLGTIMLSPHPFADEIKRLHQVKTVNLTRANYEQVRADLRGWLTTVIEGEVS